jgi:hypothetical protein
MRIETTPDYIRWAFAANSNFLEPLTVGSRLGLRISDSESKKPLNVGISANDILTIDGFLRRFSYKSGPRRPSSFANSTKRLGRQIPKLAGFGRPYCRIKIDILKHLFSAKLLIFFTSNSHAKMAPDIDGGLLQ